jgi:hypothetical protein
MVAPRRFPYMPEIRITVLPKDIQGAGVWVEQSPAARAIRRELRIPPDVICWYWKDRIQIGQTIYKIPYPSNVTVNQRDNFFLIALKEGGTIDQTPYSFTFDDQAITDSVADLPPPKSKRK